MEQESHLHFIEMNLMEMNLLLSAPFRADKMESDQIRAVMKSPSMDELLSLAHVEMRISFNS